MICVIVLEFGWGLGIDLDVELFDCVEDVDIGFEIRVVEWGCFEDGGGIDLFMFVCGVDGDSNLDCVLDVDKICGCINVCIFFWEIDGDGKVLICFLFVKGYSLLLKLFLCFSMFILFL